MADKEKSYKLNNNELKIWQATQLTQCTGHAKYTIAAEAGEYIVEFPFDWEENLTGYPYQIPIPAHVFEKHFSEIKTEKATPAKAGTSK
jgi:hypothetical protein